MEPLEQVSPIVGQSGSGGLTVIDTVSALEVADVLSVTTSEKTSVTAGSEGVHVGAVNVG